MARVIISTHDEAIYDKLAETAARMEQASRQQLHDKGKRVMWGQKVTDKFPQKYERTHRPKIEEKHSAASRRRAEVGRQQQKGDDLPIE